MKTQILNGDCIEMMKTLPDQSVNCCVTSPPYFGLRDYGHEGQIGLEQTPEAFVQKMVEVFREVKRVLRDDGTLWLNLGDSYYNYRPGKGQALVKQSCASNDQDLPQNCARRGNKLEGLKEKDIIWHKPNPMPESVQDRCTKAHEYIFLLAKSAKYYFDYEAILEPYANGQIPKGAPSKTSEREKLGLSRPPSSFGAPVDEKETNPITGSRQHRPPANVGNPMGRNKRDVWSVNVKPYREAHFATYPPELITPCILAGCPKGGTVIDPFGGSGTTAQVAMEHGRNAILCELNPEYVKLINHRLAQVQPNLL